MNIRIYSSVILNVVKDLDSSLTLRMTRRVWIPAFAGMTMLLGVNAFAQTAAAPIAQPTVAAPSAPTAPVVPNTQMQTAAPAPQPDLTQQLQKLMGRKSSQGSIGQVVVIGQLLGCTQKTVGKEATNAFYTEMQAVGKTIEGYCKAGNAAEARALLLSTVDAQHDKPVAKAALNCYDAQAATIPGMGGATMAGMAANYARWLRDPKLAAQEVKETDVCRSKRTAAAK